MKHAITRIAALLVFVGLLVAALLLVVAPALRTARGDQRPPAPASQVERWIDYWTERRQGRGVGWLRQQERTLYRTGQTRRHPEQSRAKSTGCGGGTRTRPHCQERTDNELQKPNYLHRRQPAGAPRPQHGLRRPRVSRPAFQLQAAVERSLGSKAAGAGFRDTWTLSDIDLEWHDQLAVTNPALYDVIRAARGAGGDSTMSYLLMMSVRLLELRRVLKETGSIYLHCDPTESHSLKLMMDAIWGRDCFRREVVWSTPSGFGFQVARKNWIRSHDTLLFVTLRTEGFNTQYLPPTG